jgi:hypothetical protein
VTYTKPSVQDLGSIAEHTYYAGRSGNIKGGGIPQHSDKFCEWSGGSDPNLCPVGVPITERPEGEQGNGGGGSGGGRGGGKK